MSELSGRRRRADAERSAAAILHAAVRVFGERPAASIDDVAQAAGVSRQTVYAHYPSREALHDAAVSRVTEDVVAMLDAVRLDGATAVDRLTRWLETCWEVLDRYPMLLTADLPPASPEEDRRRHLPIIDQLHRLIVAGQATGEFDPDVEPGWLVSAIMALGHAAGHEAMSGRLTAPHAGAAFRDSALRIVIRPAGR